MSSNMDERLLDLLCEKAIRGLTEAEERELTALSAGADIGTDAQSFELAAAAVLLTETDIEPMPAHLEQKILDEAEKHFAAPEGQIKGEQPTHAVQWAQPKRSFLDWFGWPVAAAASVALIFTIFYNQQRVNKMQAQLQELQRQTPAPTEPTMAQKRDELIRDARDLTRASWTKGSMRETENISGEVVWSDEKQMGYMTFRGLPPNDPNREAYQLWIFEQADLEAYPKDGGVFNVTETGEVIVPIEAKLRAVDPKAFAITVEKPGGVVVSERGKIAALAPVKPSQT